MARWGGMLLLLALAGCAGRIWHEDASADGIRLRWYTPEVTIDVARAEALEHCRRFDRRPELVREFADRDMTVADFACLDYQR
jgi:hypothetical protein